MSKLIVMEGHDYVGKTSQIHRLANSLRQSGYDVVTVRTPGGSHIAEELRGLANQNVKGEKATLEVRSLLMAAARINTYQQVILPALALGKVVLADRWIWSGYLYQVVGEQQDYTYWKMLNMMLLRERELPDLTITMTLDEQTRNERRIQARRTTPADIMEEQGNIFEARIAKAIHAADELLFMTKRIYTVNQTAEDTEVDVAETIFNQVLAVLKS